ncbi:hypothetical protein [Streptomyces halobius]|uniref:Uncharacterized protein n=1 Tax=Streptomyces halobius TaxID=2879846 RepID=A0ABY4M1V0_9ACTN|nr:hypothetical protein [Streptomyces halobius]UQA90854.1 hypothetical protein K9S39_02240 [Streptomyces halobius]
MPTQSADSGAPIYDWLVNEHGDVVAESREAAERTQREAERLLDWSTLRV